MSGILRLESLTKGNTLKQGDKTPLKYRLFDADGEKLNIAGKSAQVRLVYPDFLTIGYEKGGLTVAQDDTVTFTIDNVIPSRIYHVEIIVDEKFIFPSRADESKFTVDKSSLGTESNIVEIVGVDAVVRKAVDLINEDPNLIIDEDKLVNDIISNTGIGSIEEYYQQFNDVITDLSEEKDYHSLPEISAARGGHDTLGDRLDETTAQLAETVKKDEGGTITPVMLSQETKEQMTGGSVAVVGVNTVLEENIVDDEVTPRKIAGNEVGKNLLNLEDGTPILIDTDNGSEIASSNYLTSNFINLQVGERYPITNARVIAQYDENKTFVSAREIGIGAEPYVLTAEYPFLKVSIHNNYLNAAQVEKGTVATEYEPYKRVLPLSLIKNGYILENNIDFLNRGATIESNLQQLNENSNKNFQRNKAGAIGTLENLDLITKYSVIQDLKVIGVDPSTPVKLWALSRNYNNWNYRFIFGQKVNGVWESLIDTGSTYTVIEDVTGLAQIEYSSGGITIKMKVDYNYIPDGGRFLDGIYITDEPLFVVDPKLVMLNEEESSEGGGYNYFDQSLNTDDDVTFASVKTDGVIPMGTLVTPPEGLITGDVWADTTDSSINPVLRVKL